MASFIIRGGYLPCPLGNGDRFDQFTHQHIAILLRVFADRLQAMADHAGQHGLHIFRNHGVAFIQKCPRACGGEQGESGARRQAVRVARCFARTAQNRCV